MLRAVFALALACYPFAVYFLLERVSPASLIAVFGVLACGRLWLVTAIPRRYLLLGIAAALAFCAAAFFDTQLRILKSYPVVINFSLAAYCIYSLRNPPSAIERISQVIGIIVEGPAVSYTRRLTMVWTGFFAVSTVIAAYTALAATIGVWAVYNGAISYVLIGLLIAAEYPVRLHYQKQHRVG